MTDKDSVFLNVTLELSKLSKCVSHQVASIIVKNGRIVSIGYNGTPEGYKNCNEVFPNYDPIRDREKHKAFSDMYEIHSELNAIVFAAKYGISIDDGILYCVYQPCTECTKNIIQAGIKKIIFKYEYDRLNKCKKELNDFMEENNVELIQLNEETC